MVAWEDEQHACLARVKPEVQSQYPRGSWRQNIVMDRTWPGIWQILYIEGEEKFHMAETEDTQLVIGKADGGSCLP